VLPGAGTESLRLVAVVDGRRGRVDEEEGRREEDQLGAPVLRS
jgi:hypothetical protein